VGAAQARQVATAEGGAFMMSLAGQLAGEGLKNGMALLVCTSLMASYLALHNAASRYLFALSREKLLPRALGKLHPARYAPANASLTVSVITAVCVAGFAATRLDPYETLIPALIALGTFGIILIQAMAASAILFYLWARRESYSAPVLAASAVGALGLVIAAGLVAVNFTTLASSGASWIVHIPWLYAVTIVGGLAFAAFMKRFRPRDFAALAETSLRPDSDRPMPQARFSGRYCIVGAGPNGLLTARAFKLAGVPYDQFERHSSLGGVWDIENPGSSMYESAHFISSKHTSNFFGAPMPETFPDYPHWRQILDYVKDFAERFGLVEAITFNVEVVRATPIGPEAEGGWRVELSTGESRTYAGIAVANGIAWHPNLPTYPGQEEFEGELRHSVTYKDASEFDGKRVLVVGAGNSGVDIACDAAMRAKKAMISLRRGYHFVPKHIFGVPTDVFLAGRVHPPKGVVIPDDPEAMLRALVGDLTRYGLQAPDHKPMQSHPIMNSQILHCLAHGDLEPHVDIERFTRTGVVFKDGSSAEVDLVLFATGYDYKIPFIDEALFEWKNGRPQLYLNIFHRSLKGLAAVGYIEFASAGYQRFDEMAQMVAMDATLEALGDEEWRRMKREDRPDLRGASTYVESARHANYVDVGVYRRILSEVRERFGWPDPSDALYRPLDRRS
jgi:cation diffusion facilitator CzcD-associated flavoprotein CzcO